MLRLILENRTARDYTTIIDVCGDVAATHWNSIELRLLSVCETYQGVLTAVSIHIFWQVSGKVRFITCVVLGSDSVAIYRAIFMKIAAFPATCVPGLKL